MDPSDDVEPSPPKKPRPNCSDAKKAAYTTNFGKRHGKKGRGRKKDTSISKRQDGLNSKRSSYDFAGVGEHLGTGPDSQSIKSSGSLFDHKPVHRPQNYVSRLPWTRQTTPIRRLLRSCVPNTPMLRKRPSQITSANATKRRVGVEAGISQSPDTRSMVQNVSQAHTILWVLVKVLALDPTRNQSSPISCQQLFLRRGSPRQRN